jgi:hypothetical protein
LLLVLLLLLLLEILVELVELLTKQQVDFTNTQQVLNYPFPSIDIVAHLAAKCGGLYDNMKSNFFLKFTYKTLKKEFLLPRIY